MPKCIVLQLARNQLIRFLLADQMTRAIMEIGGHTPNPLMSLRGGFELGTPQLKGQPPFAVKRALQYGELAH